MPMGHGEVPDMTTPDPFIDFEVEETKDPKIIFGAFEYFEAAYDMMTTPRPEDHVCLEWGWFGQCKRYGVPTTTTSTTTPFQDFVITTSSTTSNTITSKSPVC